MRPLLMLCLLLMPMMTWAGEASGDSLAIARYQAAEERISADLAPVFHAGQAAWVELFRLEEAGFLQRLAGYRQRYLDVLDEAGVQDPRFDFETRARIRLTFDWFILMYPVYHGKYTGRAVGLSPETLAYLDGFDVDDPALLDMEEYLRFTQAYLHSRIRESFQSNAEAWKGLDHQWLRAGLDVASQTFRDPAVREFWHFHFIRDDIDRNGVTNMAPFIEAFDDMAVSEELERALHDLYDKERAGREGHPVHVYRSVDGFDLEAHVFEPEGLAEGERRPAEISVHGGSWSEGKPDWQFGPSSLGFVKVCIEYRTYDRHHVLPFDALADVREAVRWVRRNAAVLRVDPERIIVSGNSAGGHLALCTALDDMPGADAASRPDALILTSAVYRIGEDIWFADRLESPEALTRISPLAHIEPHMPPVLVFHGTEDVESAPYADCLEFVEAMRAAGNTVDVHPIEGYGHFLWRYGAYWREAGPARRAFLEAAGFVPGDQPGR